MSPKLGNNPKLFRLKAFTGPTQVKQLADKIRESGSIDLLEGTEHVYWTCSGDNAEHAAFRAVENIKRVHGTAFGLTPQVIREV